MSTSSYHHGHLADAVLDAGRELLERMPVGDVSVRELARAAGVSHAAPYRHFGDRDGFVLALTARCLEELVAAQGDAFAAAAPGSRLVAVGTAYVDFAVAHPFAFALVYAARPGSADTHRDLATAVERHASLLAAAVDDASQAGLVRAGAVPDDVGAALWGLAHGVAGLVGAGFLPRGRVTGILTALLQPPARGG